MAKIKEYFLSSSIALNLVKIKTSDHSNYVKIVFAGMMRSAKQSNLKLHEAENALKLFVKTIISILMISCHITLWEEYFDLFKNNCRHSSVAKI